MNKIQKYLREALKERITAIKAENLSPQEEASKIRLARDVNRELMQEAKNGRW